MNVLEWWRQMDVRQRTVLSAGVAVIAVLTVVAAWLALRTSYVPLFEGDTAPADAAAIVAELDAMGVDYHQDTDSKQLLVPADRRERLQAIIQKHVGTFKQPKGFEVFDNADFGMTEFSQRINYERGLEGELARTIMGLEGVRYARLHLVLPNSSLFSQERDQPKASVTLMTAAGKPLTQEQIEGIRQLVAYAVPGLAAERVSIHDYRGVDLVPASGSQDALSSAIDNRMKAKEAIEDYLAAKVNEVLQPLYPAGAAAVSVDVSLRMDRVNSTHDQTVPKFVAGQGRARPAPVHEAAPQAPVKTADGEAAPAPAAAPPPVATDYGIDKLHEQVEELPGSVERISVAVVVPAGGGSRLTQEEVRQLIEGAIGMNEMRGDVVTVQTADAAAAAPAPQMPIAAAPAAPSPGSKDSSDRPRRPKLFWPVSTAVALLLLAVGWWIGQRNASASRLSDAEREALLRKVKDWLRQEPDARVEP